MGDVLVRMANYAHTKPAVVRRPLVAIAFVGIFARKLLWWAFIPIFWIGYPPIMAIISLAKAIGELPMLTFNQIKDDAIDLRMNAEGSLRVWPHRKEPRP